MQKLTEQKDLFYFPHTKGTVPAPQEATPKITIHDRAPPRPKFW